MDPVEDTTEAGVAKIPVPITRLTIKRVAESVEILRFAAGTRSNDSPSLSPAATRVRTSLARAGPVDTSTSLSSVLSMSSSELCLLVSLLAILNVVRERRGDQNRR